MAETKRIDVNQGEPLKINFDGHGRIAIDEDGRILVADLKIDLLQGCIVKLAHAEVFERQQACVVREEIDCAYPGEKDWKAAYDKGYALGEQVGLLKGRRRRRWFWRV